MPVVIVLKRRWIITALAICAWWPILQLGFIADDPFMIPGDPSIQQWHIGQIVSDFATSPKPDANPEYYRPVVKLCLRAEFSLFGLRPGFYHAVDLLLVVGNALLTAEIVTRLGFPLVTAFLVGALFAVHPIPVHDLLQAIPTPLTYFFFAVSVVFFLRPGRVSWLVSLFAFVLALFCKESAVVYPVVLLLSTLLRPDISRYRVIPFFLLLVPYYFLRSIHMGAMMPLSLPDTFRFYLEAFPKILLHYVITYCIPWNLQSWPPVARLSHFWPLYLTFWILLTWCAWTVGGRRGIFCLGWVVVLLIPRGPAMVINKVMMDHWIYDSSLGLLLPMVLAGSRLYEKSLRPERMALLGFLGLVLLAWLSLCHYYVYERRTDELNYRWTLRFGSPDFALYRLGAILLQSGRAPDALVNLKRLCDQSPAQSNYENALALAYAQTGQLDAAERVWRTVLQRDPDYRPAQENWQHLERIKSSTAGNRVAS